MTMPASVRALTGSMGWFPFFVCQRIRMFYDGLRLKG